MNFAIIVASMRARSGKTLLARLLAEHFILGGTRPAVFDTDPVEAPLLARFPEDSIAFDLDRVTDQMALFDALAAPGENSRVVDLSHQTFKKFFDVMLDSEFIEEARNNGIEPVVFYIPGTDRESFALARELREGLREDCRLVFVENAFLGEIKSSIREGEDFRSLSQTKLGMLMPALDQLCMEVIDEPGFSISEFMRPPAIEMSEDMRELIRSWLVKTLAEIYKTLTALEQLERSRGSGWLFR
jgi:hypothetical protein